MKFTFNASGANAPLIREYDIASSTVIHAGEVVGTADNLLVKADSADSLLGVSAEEHTGKHDELNARADGTKLRVNIAPQAVYEAALPCFTATGGTETTLVTAASGLSTSLNSGCAVLISKAAGSANTDQVGSSRRISARTISGSAAAGDIYRIVPDVGDELVLDASGTGVAFYRAATTVKFICAYTDKARGVVGVKLKAPLLA